METASSSQVQGQGRNLAIDMLRALTMTLMIFVNDFWKIHDVPQWMEHAKWGEDFMGLADFVYPAFLFCVGLSVPYAIENRYRKGYSGESTAGHILLRVLSLLIMGAFLGNSEARLAPDFTLYRIGVYWLVAVASFFLVWNAYPKNPSRKQKTLFTCLKILGGLCLLFLALTYRKPDGKVFDTVLRVINVADSAATLSLPSGYSYERLRGTAPLTIPASSTNLLTITRTTDRTFFVAREELEPAQ